MRVWPKQLTCSMIISGGKTALVLGSPSVDLRDDQRAFMKVRLRWSLLQRSLVNTIRGVVCSAPHCSVFCVLCFVFCVFCSTMRNCGHRSAARASGQQKPADDGATLYMFNIWRVGSVSAFSKKMPGQLATSKVESEWSARGGAGSKVWSCRLGRRSGVAVKHRWEKCILVWLKQ